MATASQIQQLYVAYFGRPADPNGLASWLTSTASLTQIAQSFGTAPEFTTAFAGQTYAQQVNNLYLNLFGRQAEPEGLNAWVAELNSGRLTLSQIGLAISSGAQGSDKVALDSKITASGQWTASSNGSTAGILAYSGDPGISAGRSFLLPVLTTETIPTQAATDTQVQTLINTNAATSVTFNQIANNAILTSSTNTNNAGTGAGFSPSGNFLNGSNNTVKIGALIGATIADSTLNDGDSVVLDQGFVQSAATIVGIETLSFAGSNGGLSVGALNGVQNINFTVGSVLNGAGSTFVSTAIINIGTTGNVGLFSGLIASAVNGINLNAANGGTLTLGGTTALTITNVNTGNSSYNLIQAGSVGSFNFLAGSANTAFTLNLNASGNFLRGGNVSGGGDFILNMNSAVASAVQFGNTAASFTFNNTGNTLFSYNNGNLSTLANLFTFGVDTYQINRTAGGVAGVASSFSAAVQLKNGAVSLNFGTAQSTAAIIFSTGNNATALNTVIGAGGGQNLLTIGGTNANTAFLASGATDTVNLTFNTLSGIISLSQGIILQTDTRTALTANAGIEILNLNVYGGTSTQSHIIEAVAATTSLTTFNLNAAQNLSFTLADTANASIGLSTLGFSAADGNNTIIVGTQMSTLGRLSFFDGSGNSFISLKNLLTAQTYTGVNFGTALTAAATQLNTINLSDGGADTIVLGGQTSVTTAGFARANIIGLGVSDVLSFTSYTGTIADIVILTSNTGLVTGFISQIAMFYDGAQTFVWQVVSTATTGADLQDALAGVLNGSYATRSRWNLNANTITLIS